MSTLITTRGDVALFTCGRVAFAVLSTIVAVTAMMPVAFGTDLSATIPVGQILKSGIVIGAIVAALLTGLLAHRTSRLMRQLYLSRAELARMSHTDPLTGLLNRRGFDEAALRELAIAQRQNLPVAVMMCDIDGFKTVNDQFGHDFGDDVLVQIGDALCQFGRANRVVVARHGGEEFAALMIGVSGEEAQDRAETLRRACAARIIINRDCSVAVTVSVGLAAFAPGCGLQTMIRAADRALYEAKHLGRNQVFRGATEAGRIAA